MSFVCRLLGILILAVACSNRSADPPPPAASVSLPPAAPKATGAMAAGLESARAAAPSLPEDVPDSEEDPVAPLPVPDDGGVSL